MVGKKENREANPIRNKECYGSCWRTQTSGWNWRKLVAVLVNGKRLESAVCVNSCR